MARSMVLAWFALTAGVSGVGIAQVPVMTFDGPEANTYFGRSVAHVGDLDGDGVVDFVAGGSAYLAGTGMVRAYSGRTGSKLLEVVGPKPSTGFGFRVTGSGDVNGDGGPDFLVGTPGYDSANETDRGAVWVFSGTNGALLHFLEGDDEEDFLGFSIVGGADLDQDGFDDFVVGMPGFNSKVGGARAYSGRTGAALYTITEDTNGGGGGGGVAILDDIDGDGASDWATPAGLISPPSSGIRFVSGSSGATLFIAPVSTQGSDASFGTSMASIGDVNGDGFTDLAVGPTARSAAGPCASSQGSTDRCWPSAWASRPNSSGVPSQLWWT
jgi:FG-GAP repeat